MSAIFKRELKSYFTSPLGYIVVLLYLLLGGALFGYMFRSGYAQIESIFSYMSNFSFFLIPVLTMRLFSEEKRAKTDQALFTAPIKITHIVMGKFFAALAVIGLVNVITFIYQFIFSVMISVNWVSYLSCLLGTMLFSAALISLGLFISALTENQMVAAMGSLAATLVIMMMETIASLVQSIDLLYKVFNFIAFNTRYNSFISGLFSYSDVAFFISFTAIFLFLTVRIIEKRRWAGGSKEQSYALVTLLTFASTIIFGWQAVNQFITNNNNPNTSTLVFAIVFTLITLVSAAGSVFSALKFVKIHASRKKGTVVVSLDHKGEWKCPICNTRNTDLNNFCVKCDIQRVSNQAQAAAYVKPSKKKSVKHGAYALVISAVFVAIIIGLNVAASALAEAYPLTLDLTKDKDYSISEENLAYIEKISRDVTITVCADKKEYSDGTYASLIASNGIFDYSSGAFFQQTELLLKEYEVRSDKVQVQYIDPQSTEFSAYSSKYSSETFSTGDILIECEFELDGKTVKHYRHLDAFDLYTIESTQQSEEFYQYYYYGYSYILHESKVETAVTSSIYSVTSDKTFEVALITANGGQKVDALQSVMEVNNYSFTEIDSLVTKDIPENTDLIIIAAPTMDYSENELKKLDEFLDLEGERGKNIIYIPDATTQGENLPNLTAFIGEWGFQIHNGFAFATDASTYYYSPTIIMGTAEDSEYLGGLGDTEYLYIANAYTAISIGFDESEKRKTENIISLPESAVVWPVEADDKWTPDIAEEKGPFTAMGVATDVSYDEEYNPSYSRVMVIGGMDYISSGFNSEASVGNLKAILSAVNHMYDIKGETISFDPRTLNYDTFEVSGNTSTFMYIIFVGIIPLAILLACIFICVRRRHL